MEPDRFGDRAIYWFDDPMIWSSDDVIIAGYRIAESIGLTDLSI
jgi:hypothetical protein